MNKLKKVWLISLLLIPASIGTFNYVADPNYLFVNSSYINLYRSEYNDRQMKINYFEKINNSEYDSLIIGASRGIYLNTSYLDGNFFNFSVSNMTSQELLDITKYFEDKNGAPKEIYLILDFVNILLPQGSLIEENLSNVDNIEYFLSSLFSFTSSKRSLLNLKNSLEKKTGSRAYLHNLEVKKDKVNPRIANETIIKIAPKFYTKYNKAEIVKDNPIIWEENIKKLVSKYRDSDIKVTTSPISDKYLNEIYSSDFLFEKYITWIYMLTDIFEEVYFMTYHNELTRNFEQYSWDGSHMYPESFEQNFMIVSDKNSKYTQVLTKENVDLFINELINYRDQ